MYRLLLVLLLAAMLFCPAQAQSNPLWHTQKIKNYLPHMTWPEVEDLLTRTDMVIIPVASIEQHGPQLPIGTDYFTGEELAKLIAQKTDVLVAPILLPGISAFHMEFPGTITLSEATVQQVYFEAVQSLIQHGFRRFLLLTSHSGNENVSRYIIDRINQETPGIAVELGEAITPYIQKPKRREPLQFDHHAGVGETSDGLYLFPALVDMSKAGKNEVKLPDQLQKMLPEMNKGDATAVRVFVAQAMKPKGTGKRTSSREVTKTGVWSDQDTRTATADRGQEDSEAFVNASVQFIERWKVLQPVTPLSERRKY